MQTSAPTVFSLLPLRIPVPTQSTHLSDLLSRIDVALVRQRERDKQRFDNVKRDNPEEARHLQQERRDCQVECQARAAKLKDPFIRSLATVIFDQLYGDLNGSLPLS